MRQIQFKSWGRRGVQALILGVSLGALTACDDLLEVELPHLLTDAAIEGSGTAELQVMSAVALFECGYTAFGLMALGAEDAMESIAGVYGGGHVYDESPDTGSCDTSSTSDSWFDQIMGARAMISTDPALLVSTATGQGRGVYDRIANEWDLGAAEARLQGIGAIYMAMSIAHFGEFLCEMALDGSDIMSPTTTLGLAQTWIDRAMTHTGADFALPNSAAPSAANAAKAIRARIRWANRDFAGAASDASAVLAADPDFTHWITREAGATRRNKIWHNATEVGFSAMQGRVDWWNPSIRLANPAYPQSSTYAGTWPDPIPFTGYLFLGIGPHGETLNSLTWGSDLGPVVYAEEDRDPTTGGPVLISGFTGTHDTRVTHHQQPIQGPTPEDVPDRYDGLDDDVPYMSWQELELIIAKNELEQGNLANVITRINTVRTGASLQNIDGAYATSLNTAEELRFVLHEERKREFFAEGARYWSTKIQNTDISWFPLSQGATPFQGYSYLGAGRQHFAYSEYQSNPYFIAAGALDARATGCTNEWPGADPASGRGGQAPRLRI
jgi:hypothetical protein